MHDDGSFPRPVSARESGWLDFLLPADHPGYRPLRQHLNGLEVTGEGRWGTGDLILGRAGVEIDRTEGMQPVVSYGEVNAAIGDEDFIITLAVHQPNDDDQVEFQVGLRDIGELPGTFVERSRWSYAYWSPGAPCPATGQAVRQAPLNAEGDLLLVISPARRVLWLYDATGATNTLLPVTNFYNELMLLKRIRDAAVALDHRRLFTHPEDFTDQDLRGAFVRYNLGFRKVDHDRLVEHSQEPARPSTISGRIKKLFGGGSGS